MSDSSRHRRIVVALTAETMAALEVEAERREVTVVSLAGWLLTNHAQQVTTGQFCEGATHEDRYAVGKAFNDAKAAWFPYCGECLSTLERGGDKVRRFH